MKNTILIAALFVTSLLAAQNNQTKPEKGQKTKPTPEQRAEMRTKELTLALGLNDEQAKEVRALEENRAKQHDAKKGEMVKMKEKNVNRTEEEKIKMRSDMLEKDNAFQNEMKKILSDEQFGKWEQMREDKMKERKNEFKDKNQHKGKGNKTHKK